MGGDALARARPRHHPADVEPAGAALADGRDLRVTSRARAARMGARRWTSTFAGMLDRGEAIKLKDLNAAFQNPEADCDRLLPGVAGRRSPRADIRRRGPQQAAARLRTRPRHRRGAEVGAGHQLRPSMQTGFDQISSDVRRRVARAGDAEGERRSSAKAPELKTSPQATEQLSRRRWCSRRALREAGRLDEAMQAFERAAALVPSATGADSRTPRWPRSRSRRRIARARSPSSRRC